MFVRNEEQYFLTAFFSLFIFLSIFNAFNARTTRANIFAGILQNRVFIVIMSFIFLAQVYLIYFGGALFRTYGLTISEFVFTLALAVSVIPADIIRNFYINGDNTFVYR